MGQVRETGLMCGAVPSAETFIRQGSANPQDDAKRYDEQQENWLQVIPHFFDSTSVEQQRSPAKRTLMKLGSS